LLFKKRVFNTIRFHGLDEQIKGKNRRLTDMTGLDGVRDNLYFCLERS